MIPNSTTLILACEEGLANFEENAKKMAELKKYLIENAGDSVTVNLPEMSAPHIINVTLPSILSKSAQSLV